MAKSNTCRCIESVNGQLMPMNAKLSRSLQVNFTTGKATLSNPMIVVEKLDTKKRSKLPTLLCSFCPFCGADLDPEPKSKKKVPAAKAKSVRGAKK